MCSATGDAGVRCVSEKRRGFTLLEVLLALAIGMLILFAVYSAIDTQFKFAENGRETITQATLARSLTARLSSDLTPCIGIPDPARLRAQTPPPMTSEGDGTQPMTTQPMTDDGSEEMTSEVPEMVPAVIGTDKSLTVYVSRVPNLRGGRVMNELDRNASSPVEGDQWLIQYWLVGGNNPLGLARREIRRSLVDGDAAEMNMAGSEDYIIAREVKKIEFAYFSGSGWESSWDSVSTDNEDQFPKGPPAAIRVKFTLETVTRGGGKPIRTEFEHVIAIPTANGRPKIEASDPLGEFLP